MEHTASQPQPEGNAQDVLHVSFAFGRCVLINTGVQHLFVLGFSAAHVVFVVQPKIDQTDAQLILAAARLPGGYLPVLVISTPKTLVANTSPAAHVEASCRGVVPVRHALVMGWCACCHSR